jgi:uncharacterized membrane protein
MYFFDEKRSDNLIREKYSARKKISSIARNHFFKKNNGETTRMINFISPLLADITVEKIGQWHSIFLHFPIILFTAALVCDLLNYFNRSKALMAGHWMVIAAVVMCIPAIITGIAAASALDSNDLFLSKHRTLGYSTGMFGSLYAGLRIAVMKWKFNFKPAHYVGLSILMVALVSWTSDYGALFVNS